MSHKTTRLSDENATTFLKQIFDVWVIPEVDRRQSRGDLEKPLELYAAQVIMNVGQHPQVRINGEVKALLKLVSARAISKGELLTDSDIKEVAEIMLTDDDPNAAHITIFKHHANWNISFNYTYNSQLVLDHLAAAKEYLESARSNIIGNLVRPAVDNLFSAAELSAKAWLLMLPLEEMLGGISHGVIDRRLNLFGGKQGNAPSAFVKAFNQLKNVRSPFRYLSGPASIANQTLSEWVAAIGEMHAHIVVSIPPIYKNPSNQ